MCPVVRWISVVMVLMVSRPVAAGAPLKKGDNAPPLKLVKLLNAPAGAKTDWPSLRGRWVVLEFWATWRGPCVAAIPHLNQLMDACKAQPVVLIAITKEDPERIAKFIRQRPIHGWVAIDDDGATFEAYGVRSIPKTIVVDPQGRLAAYTDPHSLTKQVLDSLLAGKDPHRWSPDPPATSRIPPGKPRSPAPLVGVVVRPAKGQTTQYGRAVGQLWYRNISLRELISRL